MVINKDVKIPSHSIAAIKNEMRQLIEAMETSDVPEFDEWTSEEHKNNETRQGKTLEVQPQGAAPPP